MVHYSPEFLENANRYIVKMDGIQISVPNELIAQGLDGFKQYANKLKGFYPNSTIKLFEVSEKSIEF